MKPLACLLLGLLLLGAASPLHAQESEARLLRFPTIHENQIVFTYGGNLYTVAANGGIARRLTSHDGFEMFARFSPDGKTLAFTGQYDGNTEVYTMPAEGGVPKRLTFTATLSRDDVSDRMGPNNIVMGWTPDGKSILFRSRMREHNDFIGQLYLVSVKGGLPEQLPLPRGGFASYSPDGGKLAYNRIFREFRTWKRYRGGMADDVWIHDFATKKTVNITSNDASDIIPMWSGDTVYYLSDREQNKRFNLYGYNTATMETKKLTTFTDYDCRFPSVGKGAIVFENAGWLYRFDLATEKYAKVPIRILEDQVGGRTKIVNVSDDVAAYEIAPDGKRALFGARGDIFTVPVKEGPTRNLTSTPGVHDRNPKWSPDGKQIAFISDASGEDEIHLAAQDGSSAAVQLTTTGDTYKYALYWSPDSKKIAWTDKKLRLQYIDVATKKVKLVAQAKAWEIRQLCWSPDNKWLAYNQYEDEGMQRIYLYSLEQDKAVAVTDMWHSAYMPMFSGDGKYLFFVSDRDFRPIYSRTEWNHAYLDTARVYFATLSRDTPSPFQPKSDEVGGAEETKPAKDKEKDKEPKKKDDNAKVDLDGIGERILQLPTAVARYSDLASVGSSIYYIRASSSDSTRRLYMYDLKEPKEVSLGVVAGYEISADGKKMLLLREGSYYIIDLPRSSISTEKALNLSGMQVTLDHRKEWKQIYTECWRQMRDFFYDPNLHGVDWKGVYRKYEPLVEHVDHRADLTYIIGDMISELGAGHAYVGGGERPLPARVPQGLLGAELKLDEKTRYYQIAKILKGASWSKALRSPLTELGMNVKEGEYITAVNGQPTNEMANIYEALVNTVGKPVRLKISAEPKDKGGREIVVQPIANEQELYYYQWVQGNIKKVGDATGGKVGYLHVPDMLSDGLNEFVKHFYPQLRKKALIIDMRGNGGGNVSPQIIERLRRELAMVDIARNTSSSPDPFDAHYGPKVCLLNEFSASDGDLFPYRFRKYKLGKLIGRRSWGGVIGIRGSLPLLDGGTLFKPEFASYDVTGKEWIIENHGVDPDIVVDNDPAREHAGTDDQLLRGIEVALEELRIGGERVLPPPPPFPKR